ncbi:MAG: hypothetical protein M3Q22_07250 [Actinomycetota bacterium]|nr:hypothetical protein [Actinomycetota bacterium]
MLHPLWARVEPVVTELGNDPLYRASGMAMELFHSNVLAWMLRTYPEASAPLAELFGMTDYTGKKAYNHYDPNFIYRYGTVSADIPAGRADPRSSGTYSGGRRVPRRPPGGLTACSASTGDWFSAPPT